MCTYKWVGLQSIYCACIVCGVSEVYAFDRNNSLITLTNHKPNGSVLSSYSSGRQATKTNSLVTMNYTYDAAGRITRVEMPGKTTIYAYDKAGNRQSLHETYVSSQPSGYIDPQSGEEILYAIKKSEYLYSSTNELLSLIEFMYDSEGNELIQKTVAYLYDENDNEIRQRVSYLHPHDASMRQKTGGNPYGDTIDGDNISSLIEKVSSAYDGFNRLISRETIKAGVCSTVEFSYDGDNLRTKKKSRSSKDNYVEHVTRYLYDRQYVILETDDIDQVQTRYINGLNYIARIDAAEKISYYLFNGHGDVVHTVSETGEVENTYDYDIFGSPILTIETYANAIRYAYENRKKYYEQTLEVME
jgi:YD repeat-containing protein